jgi:hypothetical protein
MAAMRARPGHVSHKSVPIRVWVKPRARTSRVLGLRGGVLEVAVAAPPTDGRANEELVRVLARHFGVPASAVSIVSGAGGRSKLVALSLDDAALRRKLAELPGT